jgi:sporulation protein YlmC with PRC-barrel domain
MHVSRSGCGGVAVYDGVGRKIGQVDHLVIEKTTGKVLGVVVNVSGFVGLCHSHREIPWSELHYDPELKGLRADLPHSQGI